MERASRRIAALLALLGLTATSTGAGATTTAMPRPATVTAPEPGDITVGVDWRRVEIAPDVSPHRAVSAAGRLWVVGMRGDVAAEQQGPVLFSTADGEQWDEHDLRALGVPRATLCGTDDLRVCHPANVVLMGGDGVFLTIDSAANDEPLVSDRWAVRGDGAALEAFDATVDDGQWPEPDEGGAVLRGGRPQVGAAVDGRAVMLGAGRRDLYSPLVLHTLGLADGTRVASDPSQPFAEPGAFHSLAALEHTALGYVAIGHGPGAEQILLPSSWRSDDGEHWSGSLLNPAHDTGGDAVYSAYDLADGPAGLVVAGGLRPEGYLSDVVDPVFWHSTDGEAWEEIVAGDLPDGTATSVTALPDRYVATIVDGAGVVVLAGSPDGRQWSVLASELPPMVRLTTWDDGLVALDATHVLISKPGFAGGADAHEPVDTRPVALTRAVDPAGPADVGRYWRRVELPDGLSPYRRADTRNVVAAGAHIWALAERDERVALLSTADGATWVEHDLAAAGVPDAWLEGHGDHYSTSSVVIGLLLPDGDGVVLLLSRYPVDNDTIPPELLVVRSDGATLDVWLPETIALGAWPGPSNGDDLRYGTPLTGVAHEGRVVLIGHGQWWQPYATGDRSLVATVVEPDRQASFVAQNDPPLGGRGWQTAVALHRSGERFVLLGLTAPPGDDEGARQVTTWTSPDGIEWSGPHHAGAGGDLWDHPIGVVEGPAGLLAYGSTGTMGATDERPHPVMWWHSPDGEVWARVLPDVVGAGEVITSTWVFDGRYHAIVRDRANNVLLGSVDGVTWTREATHVPVVGHVHPWGDGVVGYTDGTIYVSRPGFTAGALVGG